MNRPPLSQRETVAVYANYLAEGEEDFYIVFRSGVVMYCDTAFNVIEAMNSPSFEWEVSNYGEIHVREIFDFIGYFPAPCEEQI